MINRAGKGRNNELLCIHMLESWGFKKFFRSTRTKWQAIDYGPCDVVATRARDESGEPCTYYVSCKTNGSYNDAHVLELIKFKHLYAHSTDIVELWDFHDAKWVQAKGSPLKALRPKTIHISTIEEKNVIKWQKELHSI